MARPKKDAEVVESAESTIVQAEETNDVKNAEEVNAEEAKVDAPVADPAVSEEPSVEAPKEPEVVVPEVAVEAKPAKKSSTKAEKKEDKKEEVTKEEVKKEAPKKVKAEPAKTEIKSGFATSKVVSNLKVFRTPCTDFYMTAISGSVIIGDTFGNFAQVTFKIAGQDGFATGFARVADLG